MGLGADGNIDSGAVFTHCPSCTLGACLLVEEVAQGTGQGGSRATWWRALKPC